ncbi:hypothetical protein K1719_010683 [Acacia pycnantha]|nr:hypothetical protein K1719_010683 [Acacia pycnantha]
MKKTQKEEEFGSLHRAGSGHSSIATNIILGIAQLWFGYSVSTFNAILGTTVLAVLRDPADRNIRPDSSMSVGCP